MPISGVIQISGESFRGDANEEAMSTDQSKEALQDAIERAKSGEESAIGLLYRSFNPALLRFLSYKVPSAFEDVASETWISIARGIRDFEGNEKDFRAWMFSIARRRMIDYLRKLSRTPKPRSLEYADQELSSPDASEQVLSNLSTSEIIGEIRTALSDEQAEVVLLRILGDFSAEDVAKIIGKSAGVIRVIQHRAMNKLGKHLLGADASQVDVTNTTLGTFP